MRRTHPPRTLAACAAALALALGATACDSDSPPTTATTASSAARTPSSPTGSTSAPPTSGTDTATKALTKPTFPEAAKERTPEGAEAFVGFYWQAVAYAWQAPDDEILASLIMPQCETCRGHQDNASSLLTKNRHYASDPFKVVRLNHVLTTDEQDRVSLMMNQQATAIVDANGKKVDEILKKSRPIVCVLKWNKKWEMFEIG